MPTNQSTYNSRVTSEALEKRFRDTFRSQGGAELVDDLYAQGVIVPVVDFTAAATDQTLAQNLQTAWDFSTGYDSVANTSSTLINNAGFWQVDLNATTRPSSSFTQELKLTITDGLTSKVVWEVNVNTVATGAITTNNVVSNQFVVFLRAGDSLVASTDNSNAVLDVWYRQIASVNGDLINPTGFTSS